VQESQDSTIDFDQPLVLSRLSCACVSKGDSTVLNSFVRLGGLKFSALEAENLIFVAVFKVTNIDIRKDFEQNMLLRGGSRLKFRALKAEN
jgi:hypothetical protein